MTETAHPSREVAEEHAELPPALDDAILTGQCGAVSFAELVRVHFEWERTLRRGVHDEELERRFRRKLEEFQESEGKILDAYWSRRRPSAVALTVKSRLRPKWWKPATWRLRRGRPPRAGDPFTDQDAIVRLHRATDWLAREARLADLLHHSDTLGIRVGEVLRGTSERIAMQWIFAVQSHLIGFIERTNGKAADEEIVAIVDSQARELGEIEHYYARAGGKSARFVYFSGMVWGAFFSALLAGVLAGALWLGGWFDDRNVNGIQTFFVSYAAGGIGAIVSVMFRMAGEDKFELDYEVGRPTIRRLGAFRPFIGAIFGVALYFLIASGLPQVELPNTDDAFFYYGTVAFLAGFFERRTKIILGQAEETLGKSLGLGAESAGREEPASGGT